MSQSLPQIPSKPTIRLSTLTPEHAVHQRYSQGAQQPVEELCCPVVYDPQYLKIIPQEILDRDYGCGDPTPFVRVGDTVLDLGSGGGKLCYIAAQVVGPTGRVIGVDCNQDMLALARKYQQTVADTLGYANVEFRSGMIQDLQLDLDRLAEQLAQQPIGDQHQWLQMRFVEDKLRQDHPLIADDSVDCVLSNCVINLVRPTDRRQLFTEVFRVLNRRGRAAISDIVCDEDVPEELKHDPGLWSGCIAGAYREDQFLQAFADAGFHGIEIVKREQQPWRVVQGIEFRAVTVVAYKGKQGPSWDRNQAVIYRGPFKKVEDDDGRVYQRGRRTAVCDKTFHLLQCEPYQGMFDPVEPYQSIPLEDAVPFDCRRTPVRDPRETKGEHYNATSEEGSSCCKPESCC